MPVPRYEPIRLLVVGLSTLARDLVEDAGAGEVELVDAPPSSDLISAINEADADFILVPLEQSRLPAEVKRFLADQSHVRVIGVQESQGHAFLYQLVPETRELGEVTPVELVDVIKSSAVQRTEIA